MNKYELNKVVDSLMHGEIVALPTDTTFGIACLIDNPLGYRRIFDIKKRPFEKSLPILFSNYDQISKIVEWSVLARSLAESEWPGSTTLILKLKRFDHYYFAQHETIAIRMPNHNNCLKIIEKTGPLFVTSCNISGYPPLINYKDVIHNFEQEIDYIVRDNANGEKPSKIINTINNEILRV